MRENKMRIKKRERVMKKNNKKMRKMRKIRQKKKILKRRHNRNKRYPEDNYSSEEEDEYTAHYGERVSIYCDVVYTESGKLEQRVVYGNSNFNKNGRVVPVLRENLNPWTEVMLEDLRNRCDYCNAKPGDCPC
jgi:hypothetical protein